MIVLATNQWLGKADISGPSSGIAALLDWMRATPGVFVVRSGARNVEAQALIYSWGRTARNPDMDRTGDPGPNGLGVLATRTMDSRHLRDSSGQFRAVDVECPAAAGAALNSEARRLGLGLLSWDPGHYEDQSLTTGEVAQAVAGSGAVVLFLVVAALLFAPR